jgi:hypothetical protein
MHEFRVYTCVHLLVSLSRPDTPTETQNVLRR